MIVSMRCGVFECRLLVWCGFWNILSDLETNSIETYRRYNQSQKSTPILIRNLLVLVFKPRFSWLLTVVDRMKHFITAPLCYCLT